MQTERSRCQDFLRAPTTGNCRRGPRSNAKRQPAGIIAPRAPTPHQVAEARKTPPAGPDAHQESSGPAAVGCAPERTSVLLFFFVFGCSPCCALFFLLSFFFCSLFFFSRFSLVFFHFFLVLHAGTQHAAEFGTLPAMETPRPEGAR